MSILQGIMLHNHFNDIETHVNCLHHSHHLKLNIFSLEDNSAILANASLYCLSIISTNGNEL